MLDRADSPATRTFPFAGIAHRPYEQSNITAFWGDIAPTQQHLTDIILTQDTVTIRGMFGRTYSHDRFPRCVRVDRRIYLEDGHHRLVDAAIRGHRTILVRVWDL